MAGGLLKALGGVLLVVGILAVLAGGGAAAYGFLDQRNNQENSGLLGPDRERGETNKLLVQAGLAAAALGLVATVVGVVLLAAGGGRANRVLAKAMRASAGGSGAASAPTAPPRRIGTVVTASLAGALALGLLVAIALGGDGADSLGTSGEGATEKQREGQLGEVVRQGTAPGGPTVLGGSALPAQGTPDFEAPAGTTRIQVVGAWSPGDLCCKSLQFRLYQEDASGSRAVDDQVLAPGEHWNVTVDLSKGTIFHVSAFPGEDGVSQGQDYEVRLTFWSA